MDEEWVRRKAAELRALAQASRELVKESNELLQRALAARRQHPIADGPYCPWPPPPPPDFEGSTSSDPDRSTR